MQCATFAILFGTFPKGYKKYIWLRYCTTTREIPGLIPSRVLGNFTAISSFCLYSVSLRSTQPNRNEYLEISLRVKQGQCVELKTLLS